MFAGSGLFICDHRVDRAREELEATSDQVDKERRRLNRRRRASGGEGGAGAGHVALSECAEVWDAVPMDFDQRLIRRVDRWFDASSTA
jgi:hypothetical protein